MHGRMTSRFLSLWCISAGIFISGCQPKIPAQAVFKADHATASRDTHEAIDKKHMIVSQGRASTLAAQKMFAQGGNIIDAAVATSFALAVERPQSTGLGGGGFMLIYLAESKKVAAVDFRERAPMKAHETMFQDQTGEPIKGLSREGALASGVPGLVAGLVDIHTKYGTLPLARVLQPAIELAEGGLVVYPHLARALEAKKAVLQQYPASKALFFKPDGTPYREGDRLIQANLARTLREIARKGHTGFYQGWVAQSLVAEQQRLGGFIRQADLDAYDVKWRQPVQGSYKEHTIFSMPSPSSGGIHLIQMMHILRNDDLKKMGPYAPASIHHTASAMQLAFRDRAQYLGDADFIDLPTEGLTSLAYADRQRALINPTQARRSDDLPSTDPFAFESDETTHFSIADGAGNMVASTQTINGWVGSGVVVPEAGFVMNNEMDDFVVKAGVPNMFGLVGKKENAPAPGKRPLSSMSPTLIFKAGKPLLALGSPAGSRIITCVTLTALNYLEYDLPLFEAVSGMRYHHQWLPDHIEVESPGFSKQTRRKLEKLGYTVKDKDIGCKVQAIAFKDGALHGVSDPRGEGLALGATTPLPADIQNYQGPVVQD